MSLVNAGVRLGGGPLKTYGGITASSIDATRHAQSGNLRNFHAGQATVGVSSKNGFPNGYRHPASWSMGIKPGSMSSFALVAGVGTQQPANAAGGLNADATLIGAGALAAIGELIVSAVATILGTGSFTGSPQAVLNAVAALAGSGDIAGAIVALGHALAALAGSSNSNIVARATGELGASITSVTELSPESLASAVWNSAEGAFLYALAHNRVVTNPVDGTITIFDSDGTTVLYEAPLWRNHTGTLPYSGTGADRRDEYQPG